MGDRNSFKMVAVYSRVRYDVAPDDKVERHDAWCYQLPTAVFNEIRAQLLIDLGKEAMEALCASPATLQEFAVKLHKRGQEELRSHYPLLPRKVFRPPGW